MPGGQEGAGAIVYCLRGVSSRSRALKRLGLTLLHTMTTQGGILSSQLTHGSIFRSHGLNFSST